MSIFERLAPEPGAGPRYPECWLARVVSVDDPDNLARVQIRILSFDGPEKQDAPIWARVAVAVAGASRGTFLLPDVDDEVLVSFIGGDPRMPVVVGSLWNGRDAPTETLGGARGVDRWSFTSKDGTRISVVEESQGSSTVKVEVPGNVNATFTQESGGKIELSTNMGTITIDSQGITVQASSTVKVEAARVNVSAATVNVDAAMATFSGVVQCQTLLTTTCVATTYTPGAGNVW